MFHRIIILTVFALVFFVSAFPTIAQGEQAVMVYGQPDFSSNAVNQDRTAGPDTLNFPLGISVDSGGGVYVADRNNHRVLFYANDGDAIADRVYGQHGNFNAYIANFDGIAGSGGGPTADTLSMPTVVTTAPDGGIYITDRENHRVLFYANDGDTTADRVYGQYGNFNINPPNNNAFGGYGNPSADNIGVFTLGVVASADGLYVSDSSNNRVLYYANDGDTTADRVYGQFDSFTVAVINNDGTGQSGTPSAQSMNFPRGLVLDSTGGLYVADRENSRVLYFANDGDTVADRVYGQFDSFTTNVDNNDGSGNIGTPSANSLYRPKGVAVDVNDGLYVSDSLNSRVLYFANDGDTTADWVFGQYGSFEMNAKNNDGSGNSGTPSAQNLNEPQGVAVGPDERIYIADTGNNRILVVPR